MRFREELRRESEAWVSEGLMTAEQAEAIRARYDGVTAEEPRGRATSALAVIGAIAVGLGVIGFFAANWEEMSHGLRLFLIVVAIAASYAGGYRLRDATDRAPKVGVALYLLGVLLFGASLFLVGQMYHVEAHDPLALLLWAAGAVATALVVRSSAVGVAAVLILTGWVGYEVGLALEDSGASLGGLPVAAILYGSGLYGLGTAARERVRGDWLADTAFDATGRRVGIAVAAAGIFVCTFSGAAEELAEAGDELRGAIVGGFALLVVLALSGAAALALSRRPTGRYEGGSVAVSVAAVLAALVAGGSATLYALVFNVLVAAVALGAIYAGYVTDEAWLVNSGVVLVALDLVARYFDVFWDALPRSAGLIGAGLVVLAIAYFLERQRKRLLERMAA